MYHCVIVLIVSLGDILPLVLNADVGWDVSALVESAFFLNQDSNMSGFCCCCFLTVGSKREESEGKMGQNLTETNGNWDGLTLARKVR